MNTLQVLPGSQSDNTDQWIVEQLDACTTLQSSEVFLFMSMGLLSIFMVFITLPFAIVTGNSCQCCKKRNQKLQVELYLKALSLISGVLFCAFLIYWVLFSVYYYTGDTTAKVLFPGLVLVPFSINLIFYTLSGTVSFIGGLFFSKCSMVGTEALRLSRCHRLGFGLLSLTLSASVYHFLFVVLALLQDAVTVTSFLVIFGTVLLLLFLSICSVIHQYRKTQFRASFGLVLTLKIIIFVLYIISVKAFGSVLLEEDSYTATPAWLLVVTLLSVSVLSFASSVFILIPKKPPQADDEEGRHPPTSSNAGHPLALDLESGGVRNQPGLAPLTSALAKLPKDWALVIPTVVSAWRTRERANQGGGGGGGCGGRRGGGGGGGGRGGGGEGRGQGAGGGGGSTKEDSSDGEK